MILAKVGFAPMKIVGIEGLTSSQIAEELQRGGKFVYFKYCISVVILTFQRPSDIYFIRANESAFLKGFGFSLITLALGWWGFPWGPIYSIICLVHNLGGGEDVTNSVQASLALGNSLGTGFAESGSLTATEPGGGLGTATAAQSGSSNKALLVIGGGGVIIVAGLMAACGLLIGCSGTRGLFRDPNENTPSQITLSEVEAKGAAERQWLDLKEGHLFLQEEMVIGKQQSGKGAGSKVRVVYVPLVSEGVRDDWKMMLMGKESANPSPDDYRILIQFDPEKFEKEFPREKRNPVKLLEEPSVRYELTGRVVKLPDEDRKVVEPELKRMSPEVPMDHFVIVEPGKPLSKEESRNFTITMITMGYGCAFTSIAVIVMLVILMFRSMRT
jgi:hypothetical protein